MVLIDTKIKRFENFHLSKKVSSKRNLRHKVVGLLTFSVMPNVSGLIIFESRNIYLIFSDNSLRSHVLSSKNGYCIQIDYFCIS